jgi:cystathionine beta-lyase
MKIAYDFDKIIDRTGTSCAKWDSTEELFGEKDLLPMWVADMDFQSPPAIIDALVKHTLVGWIVGLWDSLITTWNTLLYTS